MYYRMTRLHWDEHQYDELLTWAGSVQERAEAIHGLLFADLVRSGPDNGMLIAAYDSESAAEAALSAGLMEEMARFLVRTPHGHEGTVVHSYGAR